MLTCSGCDDGSGAEVRDWKLARRISMRDTFQFLRSLRRARVRQIADRKLFVTDCRQFRNNKSLWTCSAIG